MLVLLGTEHIDDAGTFNQLDPWGALLDTDVLADVRDAGIFNQQDPWGVLVLQQEAREPDPNPNDPDWRKIVEAVGSNLHRFGDTDYNPVATGCDCYSTDHEKDGMCWTVTKCYGPDCEIYYRVSASKPCDKKDFCCDDETPLTKGTLVFDPACTGVLRAWVLYDDPIDNKYYGPGKVGETMIAQGVILGDRGGVYKITDGCCVLVNCKPDGTWGLNTCERKGSRVAAYLVRRLYCGDLVPSSDFGRQPLIPTVEEFRNPPTVW